MSETLFEIRQSLYHRQRFITPIVKNLDTGEIYSHSELSKVPTGVDPSILSQSQKRADLGELLCAPVVPYIPASWHPNFITSINHVCNWILFTLAFSINLFPDNPNIRVIILVLCAWMNFCCMMLDCLDGMHARRTKQCSKLGEFLDHWLDAMHVPLVCGGITHSLHMATTLAVGVIFLNNMVYNAQLIVYHYKRVFMQTSGVEGQVLTSGFYLIAAAAEAYDPTHTQGTLMIANTIGVIACIVSVKLTYDFVARHDAIMLEKCALFFILNAGFSALYLFSYLSEIGYILTMAIISFRVTGCFVLYSILQQPYKGYDLNLYLWLLVFGWTHILMRPILVRQMYENALPYIPPDWDLLGDFTVQSLLPYIMFIHIGIHQAKILIKYYYKLR